MRRWNRQTGTAVASLADEGRTSPARTRSLVPRVVRVMATVQSFMPELEIAPVSTRCSSRNRLLGRFAYYMDTYGMHVMHGRAPAIATGIATALTRPQRLSRCGRRGRALDRQQPPDARRRNVGLPRDCSCSAARCPVTKRPVLADEQAKSQVGAVRRRWTTRSTRCSLALGAEASFCGEDDRQRPSAHDRGAPPRGYAPGNRVRGDAELQRVQRRRVRHAPRTAAASTTRSGSSRGSRSSSTRARAASRSARTSR